MTDSLCPVCILAGGLGSRLGERVRDTPKPLIEVAGRPFLAHQLELLRAHGARRIVLCVGYLGERIEQEIGARPLGLDVRYSYDGPELVGTAGAVRRALPLLGERFLVLYGDTYLRIDYRAVAAVLVTSGLPALMTVLHNRNRLEPSNAVFDDGLVVRYDKRHATSDMEWIDYGLGAMTAAALTSSEPESPDLADVYRELADKRLLAGYEATERFYEIGTPGSLAETDAFLRSASRT